MKHLFSRVSLSFEETGIMRRILIALPLLLLVTTLTALAANEWKPRQVVAEALLDEDGYQRAEIVAEGSYRFTPPHIIVRLGVPVKLKVHLTSWLVPHNIAMNSPEAGMKFSVSLSDLKRTIRFTPTAVGRYPFYCDKKFLFFKSHREKGMEGIIEVRESKSAPSPLR